MNSSSKYPVAILAGLCLLLTTALFMPGCGLGEGIHVSRDEGKSTARFRYEYEAIPNAMVVREDTEPRWQLGRYVFVRGADRVLVASRITSWSENATKKQRETGNIPNLEDRMLERLWITIPQGTAVGEELDLHTLGYRFLVNYDQGMINDAQFARPFRVLGNVRILEEHEDYLLVRLRVRLTTADTTEWNILEDQIRMPLVPTGIYAKQAEPDAVVYAVSRPGEVPFQGLTPVDLGPGGGVERMPAQPVTPAPSIQGAIEATPAGSPSAAAAGAAAAAAAGATPSTDNPPTTPPAASGNAQAPAAGTPGEVGGKWYARTPAWEIYLQLNEDESFIHRAARPHSEPAIITGQWRMRSGYLVLHIKTFTIGGVSQMGSRSENPYGILQLNWKDPHTVNMDGDLPGPGPTRGGYTLRKAIYPDLRQMPVMTYLPDSQEPQYVGQADQAGGGQAPPVDVFK